MLKLNTCNHKYAYVIIKKMKNTEKHPHSGHRKRLRNLIDNAGLKSLSDIQIVEFILTLTHARCDTNVIAHRLIDKFGSISKILDADIQTLTQIEGVGLVTAQMLTYLPQIFDIYKEDKNKKKFPCKTVGDIYNYFNNIFSDKTNEQFVVAYVTAKNMFDGYQILSTGEMLEVKVDKLEIAKSIINHNSKSVIVGHNHPFGSCKPSATDYDSHIYLTQLFSTLGIIMIDNIIIGNDGMFSFKNTQQIKF